MLIKPDKFDLGDLRLNPEEGVAKAREENLKISAKFKIPNQALLENKEMAAGRPMHYSELIRRIQILNPNIICKDGGIKGAIQVRYPFPPQEPGDPDTKYITGFYKDVLPEFSSVQVDKWGKPVRENRGWRTVLLVLIHAKILSYKQVVSAFGEPEGKRSVLWREQVQDKRDRLV